jgi:hypothetical protein
VLTVVVDDNETILGGNSSSSYRFQKKPYPGALSILQVSSMDRHNPLKSTMPIQVRLFHLLKVDPACSFRRRHLARNRGSWNGIRDGISIMFQ